ncbi:hypothetical protein BH09PAT4_BH09PAT4_06080 [soil metagenome]
MNTTIWKVPGEQTERICALLLRNVAQTQWCGSVFGASSEMPLRALSYVMSALNIRDNIFPEAQLQVITPINAAEVINGIDTETARLEANKLEICSMGLASYLTGTPRMAFMYAQDVPSNDFTKEVEKVVESDEGLQKLFARKKQQKQSYASYIAAHLLIHDAPASLVDTSTGPGQEEIQGAPRIISIGAQSERPFYAARMACKRAGVLPPHAVDATAQLFTRHVLPPYIACRQGEPGIFNFEELVGEPITHPVASVERDLRFFQERLGPSRKEKQHE